MKGEPVAVEKKYFTKYLISSIKIKNQVSNIAIIIIAAGTGYKLLQQPEIFITLQFPCAESYLKREPLARVVKF